MLHPNQDILGAVQEGRCSGLSDANPYEPDDKKRYLGWEEGHKAVIKNHKLQIKWNGLPWYRKLLCKIGFHDYRYKLVPGRPHYNPQTRQIDRRDPIIRVPICKHCEL
jgi:hypothetical protein